MYEDERAKENIKTKQKTTKEERRVVGYGKGEALKKILK